MSSDNSFVDDNEGNEEKIRNVRPTGKYQKAFFAYNHKNCKSVSPKKSDSNPKASMTKSNSSGLEKIASSARTPKWSFHRRVLPQHLTALSSPEGKKLFLDSLTNGCAESYFLLAEQFLTQSEPAYCGLSTLVMVLNALGIDPNVRWKSGWRWFDDDTIIAGCCLDKEIMLKEGITMDQFRMMGRCNGAVIDMYRPTSITSLNDNSKERLEKQQLHSISDINLFRMHVLQCVQNDHTSNPGSFLVASYLRSALQQTGGGHFSPISAYHMETDQVLILDVARFKYKPHWVGLEELFNAMSFKDSATDQSRGWFVVHALPRKSSALDLGDKVRPGELVNVGKDICPIGEIKVSFCSIRCKTNSEKNSKR